jgi:glucosamine-6-phosphate deaminase
MSALVQTTHKVTVILCSVTCSTTQISSLSSRCRVKTLTSNTVADNSHFFNDGEYQPRCAITLGIANILEGPKVVLLVTGSGKSEAVKAMIEGPVSSMRPASALQMHKKLLADNDHVGFRSN